MYVRGRTHGNNYNRLMSFRAAILRLSGQTLRDNCSQVLLRAANWLSLDEVCHDDCR